MSIFKFEAPLKVMIKDLTFFSKSDDFWLYSYKGESKTILKLNKIHVQGEISKTAGFLKEILIVNDGTGKAKITRGSQVPGDFSWVNEGIYCSIIGHLIDNGKVPHISAIKISKITNMVLLDMWPFEVLELQNVVQDKFLPRLQEEELKE